MRKLSMKMTSICFYVLLLIMGSVNLPVAAASMPTTVNVVSTNYNTLSVSWNAVDQADGYDLYRATSASGTYALLTSTEDLAYVNTGLAFNTTYYYKVQPYFVIDSIKVPGTLSTPGYAKTALNTPTNVKATPYAYNANIITWNAVPGAYRYEIYRSSGTSTTFALLVTLATNTYINTGLATASRYNYKVRAYRFVGTTKVYTAFSAVSYAFPIPAAPTNPVAASTGYNSIRVSFNGVTGANGYEISTALSATGPFTLLPLTTLTAVSINNLSSNVPVYVRIRAYRYVGATKIYGFYSTIVYGTPVPATPSMTITSPSYDSLRLAWAAIPGASGYDLYRLNTTNNTYELLQNLTGLNYTDDNLSPGTRYTYALVAYRMVDAVKVVSKTSTTVSGKPVPTPVTNFRVSMPGISFVNLAWSSVEGATGYEILRASWSGGTYNPIASVEGVTAYSNTGLAFNTAYYYKIRAYTTVNSIKVYGALSAAIGVRTVPSTMTLTLNNINSRTNVLSWAGLTGASGYQIYYSTGSSTSYYLLKTTTSTSFTHAGLSLNGRYNYKIRAYRMVGTTAVYGAFSSIKSIIVSYSASELLGLVTNQLSTAITKITNPEEKAILVKIKAAIDARRLNPSYDYLTPANETKVLFRALSASEKTHLMLTIIVYVNTDYLLRLSELLPIQ